MTLFSHSLQSVLLLPLQWHLCGLFLAIFLVYFEYKSKRSGIFVIFLWNLSGVLLHELAHFSVGLMLCAKPSGFSLIPHRQNNGYQLGSVSFKRLNAFNSLPIGLAPLGLVAVAFFICENWTHWFNPTLVSTLGLYLASFVLVYNSLPSRQDLKIAFGIKSILVYGVAAFIIYEYIFPQM